MGVLRTKRISGLVHRFPRVGSPGNPPGVGSSAMPRHKKKIFRFHMKKILKIIFLHEKKVFLRKREIFVLHKFVLYIHKVLFFCQKKIFFLHKNKVFFLVQDEDEDWSPEKLKMVKIYFFPKLSRDLWGVICYHHWYLRAGLEGPEKDFFELRNEL